jgi:hypothetical protein
MYAKICGLELLSSYITELGIGDILSLEALIKNPLDWHHFYEKILLIKKGGKTDFTVVTSEGDRLVGSGIVQEVEKWSNNGKFGFKIKVSVSKQKSLTDKRIKLHNLAQKYHNSMLQKPTSATPSVQPLVPDASVEPNNDIVAQVPKL